MLLSHFLNDFLNKNNNNNVLLLWGQWFYNGEDCIICANFNNKLCLTKKGWILDPPQRWQYYKRCLPHSCNVALRRCILRSLQNISRVSVLPDNPQLQFSVAVKVTEIWHWRHSARKEVTCLYRNRSFFLSFLFSCLPSCVMGLSACSDATQNCCVRLCLGLPNGRRSVGV